MRNFFRKCGETIRKTWCWTLLLTLFICVLVFWVGPLIAVADHDILAPLSTRILVSIILLAIWLVGVLVARPLQKARRRKQLNADQLKQEVENDEQVDDEIHLLKERLNQAISVIKHSSFYGKRRASRYELPWYLVMGESGSGKTAMLENSGVDFPLNKTDERMTRDIGQTRYCDWYFANQGVMIDVGGRYMQHEEDSVSARVWNQFLQQIYLKRRRRPLNGIVFTLDMSQLLQQGETALEQYARTVRARIQHIQSTLNADIPVYLMLTKSDRLDGFNAFFDQLTKEEREQIVGVTFKEGADGTQVDTLRQEFEELVRRINDQVISKIQNERDIKRRGEIIRFPLQLAAIVESLSVFVEIAFGRNRYHLPTRLRGIYLTSAPQIDFAQQMDASTLSIGRNIGLQRDLLPMATQNKGFFIRRVLEDLVFNEGDLATVDTRYERGQRWTNRFAYICALIVVVGIGSTWMRVFFDNNQRQQTLRDLRTKYAGEQQRIPPVSDTPQILPVLQTLHEATQIYPESNRSDLVYKLSLYQGKQINPVVEQAYEQQLRGMMLPKIKQLLEEQLRGGTDDRDYLMKALRAYLMLHDPKHLDNNYLRHWISLSWADIYNGQATMQNALLAHFDKLLAIGFKPIDIDQQLVADTQNLLKQESTATLIYRMIKEDPLATTLPAIHFDDAQGVQDKTFDGGDYSIPGLYTEHGYKDVFLRKGLSLIKDIMRDNWVLGSSDDMSDHEFEVIYSQVETLYFQDYMNFWTQAVSQLTVRPTTDLTDATNMMNNLTNNQPIQKILKLIKDNTEFKLPDGVTDAAGEMAEKKLGRTQLAKNPMGKAALGQAVGQAGDAFNVMQSAGPKQAVIQKFLPYDQLMQDNSTPTGALQDAITSLGAVQAVYNGLAHAPDQEIAAYQMASDRMSGHPDELNQLRIAAERLPEPVRTWFLQIGTQAWRMTLDKATDYIQSQYHSDVYSVYKSNIKDRYPFDNSDKDVTLGDFNDFFKKGGVLDQFVNGPLKPFFSSRGGQLYARAIDGEGIQLSNRSLQQFRRALRIQKVFFADSDGEASVQFKIQPQELDSSALKSTLNYAGKVLDYQHGPIIPMDFTWPLNAGNSSSSLSLQDLNGRETLVTKQNGPWSLFRLLDQCNVQTRDGDDQLKISITNAGMQAQYLLTSSHSPNPFQRSLLSDFALTDSL